MGGMLLGMHFVHFNNLELSDGGKMLALYALLHLIRGAAIFSHYPLLQNFGYGLSAKESIVLTLSGLKGAISTALALIAYNETGLNDRFRSIMLFFTTGICGLTIVFDSMLMKSAVKHFGMEALTEVQENILVGVTTGILQHTSKKVEHLRNHKQFKLVRWDFVMKFAGPKRLLAQIMKSSKIGAKLLKRHKDDSAEQLLNRYTKKFNLTSTALVGETRRRFYTTLKGIYWHMFESGHCMGITSLILINVTNKALDCDKSCMTDWDMLKAEVYNEKYMKLLNRLVKMPLVGKVFRVVLNNLLLRAYDASFSFITAHEEAENIMDQMEVDIDEQLFAEVMEEAHAQVEKCKEFLLNVVIDGYPDLVVQLQTTKACKCLIVSQKKLTKKTFELGIIKELEFKYLHSALNSSRQRVKKKLKFDLPSLKQILINRFPAATPEEIEEILPNIIETTVTPGQVIFKEEEFANGGFLILRGRVREKSSWVSQDLTIGNIVGAQHLLPEYLKNTSTATAVTQTILACLPRRIFKTHNFFVDLFKEAAEELILLNREKFSLAGVKNEHIFRVVSHSVVKHLYPGDSVDLNNGILVFFGEVKAGKPALCYLPPKNRTVDVEVESVCLVFPLLLGVMIQQLDSLSQAFASYYVKSPAKSIKMSDKVKNSDLIGLNAIHKVQRMHTMTKIKVN
jgi:hypothetical protein